MKFLHDHLASQAQQKTYPSLAMLIPALLSLPYIVPRYTIARQSPSRMQTDPDARNRQAY